MVDAKEYGQEIRDLKDELTLLGLHSFRYNLNLDKEYAIVLTIDEYENGKLLKTHYNFGASTLYPIIEDDEIAGWNNIPYIRIIFNHSDKENLKIRFAFPMGHAEKTLTNKHAENSYQFRQFTLPGTWDTGTKVPLIAYASFYYDEEAKCYRFCGSMYPKDMEDELFKLSPHYFIVSATFNEAKKK